MWAGKDPLVLFQKFFLFDVFYALAIFKGMTYEYLIYIYL